MGLIATSSMYLLTILDLWCNLKVNSLSFSIIFSKEKLGLLFIKKEKLSDFIRVLNLKS